MDTNLVIIFIIIILCGVVCATCGFEAMAVTAFVSLGILLLSCSERFGQDIDAENESDTDTNIDTLKENIVGSETPLDIDRMTIEVKEALENKVLQDLTQFNTRKEIDVELENRVFKDTNKHLDNSEAIKEIFDRDETKERKWLTGDELLANKMAHVSVKNRNAIHNRTRFTSDNFRKYYQEEMDSEEHRVWWERDVLEDET